jgi:hypothetical protein
MRTLKTWLGVSLTALFAACFPISVAAQQGIAASPAGSPLISHVELFNTAKNGGTPIPYFGGEGAGVAYDPATGDVYFAENPFVGAGTPQIVVIHSNGAWSPVPPPGPPFSGFGALTALVFYNGNLYVADGNGYTNSYAGGQPTPLNVIWQYVPTNNAWSQIVTNINNPTGIAFGPSGNLYVASWGDKIVYEYPYSSSGSFGPPSAFWTAPDPQAAPYAIAFDQIQEFLYICGFGPENSNGTKVFRVGYGTNSVFFDSAAADPSAVYFTNGFAEPASLAFDANDYLYVSYYNARKIVRIAPNGTSVAVFPGGGTADDAPNGIAVTPQGDVFTVVLGSSTADGNVALIRIHGTGPSINASFDFSPAVNGGPWSYGYTGSSGTAFTLLSSSPNMAATDFIASSPSPYGLDFWLTNPPYDSPKLDPDTVHNGGASTLTPFCCAVIPPNGLGLQPGPNGSGVGADLRWTELFSADYLVFGLWSGLNFAAPTNTSVTIASSGGTPPNPLVINTFGGGGSIFNQFSFDTNNGGPGNTVDFNVTAGTNNGMTGLDAVVVQAADATPLTFSGSAVWFGAQAVNTQSPVTTTTVTNNGSDDVTITDLEYVGADVLHFQEMPFTCHLNQVLAAGMTCTFAEAFQPTGLGARNAFVLITSTDNITGQTVTEQIPLVGIGVANTTVSLGASGNPVTFGGNVTYTATVTPAAAQNVIGSVQFYDGQTPLGTVTVDPAHWTASYTQTAPSSGLHAITAVFIPGSSALVGASSASLTESIAPGPPTVTLTAPATATYHSTFSVTASTNASTTPSITASGVCTIAGNVVTMTSGTGKCTVTASWPADTNYLAASATQTTTATTAASTVALVSSANPVQQGQSVTLTATVTPGTPTGSVTFLDGASALGTNPLAGGSATFMTSALAAGSHSLTASYAGDANFAPSTSTAVNLSVSVLLPPVVITDNEMIHVTDASSFPDVFASEKITVTDQVIIKILSPTTISISAPSVTFGNAASATVSVSSPGGTVSGNATLSVDGGAASTMSLTNGSATINLGALGAGSHTLSASFAAQGSFTGSSAQTTLVVSPANQTITLAGVPSNALFGQGPFALNATANSGLAVALTASGNCSLTASSLSITGVGNCTVTAAQPGNGNYNAASTVTSKFTIGPDLTTTALSVSPATVQYSDYTTLTATVSSVAAGGQALAGNVQFYLNGSTVGSPVPINSSGVATLSQLRVNLAAGSDPVKAVFSSSNANFGGNTGTTTQNVTQENAFILYSGDTIAQVGSPLALRATVWDSAAAGYPGVNPETGANATIGNITLMWIAFDIYPAGSCGGGTPSTVYAQVALTAAAGVGTATTTLNSASEVSYCVVPRLVAGTAGGTNQFYTAPNAETVGVDFYVNSGQFATGGGSVNDPSGSQGQFAVHARYNSTGSPKGQMVYVYQALYNGVLADFTIQSNALSALQFTGTTNPISATLQGKASIQINRASDGYPLFSAGNYTFSATVTDSGQNGTAGKQFSLIVYDSSGAPYHSVPAGTPLQGGNVVVHSH